MIIGKKANFLAVALCLFSSSIQAKTLLDDIFSALNRNKVTQMEFVEEKYSDMLYIPLIQRGRLVYEPPDTLIREETSPQSGRLYAKGDRILIDEDGTRKEIMLSDLPALQGFIESIRALLAGDLAALQKYHTVKAKGSLQEWILELTSEDAELRKHIQSMSITGSGTGIDSITIRENFDSRTILKLTPIINAH